MFNKKEEYVKTIYNNKYKLNIIISVLILIFLFLSDIYFIWINGLNIINSDASSEMILSMQLNKEGKILPLTENWFYSTELRVLNTQLIYRIALAFSPDNWHLAKTISVSIFLLILILCAIWLTVKMGYAEYALWLACAIIAPFGFWYGWNVIFNSYYVPHIAISLASFALIFSIMRAKSNLHKKIQIVILLLLGFIAGCGGVRQLMICYVPLTAASVMMLYLKKGNTETKKISILTCLLFSTACIGYLFNNKILSRLFHFTDHSSTMWGTFDFEKIWKCLGDFFHLFGWHDEVNIFSFRGIGNVLGILLVTIAFASVIYHLRNLQKLDDFEGLIILFFIFAFLIQLLVFSEAGPYNESYWVPTAPFVFIILLITIKKAKDLFQKGIIIAIFTFMLLLCSRATFRNPFSDNVPNSMAIRNVAEWLTDLGYTQGLATFWNSNILTELSDGKIEMWTIEDDYIHLKCREWLQITEHVENHPNGPVFLILTKKETESNANLIENLSSYLIYGDDNFIIYHFEDINQYLNLVN